jgi:hypothetical protein
MRELRFRAFDKVAKQMSPPFGLFGEFTLMGAVHDWQREARKDAGGYYDSLKMLDDLELMQFTGLKDFRGVDIFDGDVLSRDEFDSWIVVWDDGAFNIYNSQRPSDLYRLHKNSLIDRSVIGNIHQSPSLLNTTTNKEI